MTIYKISMKFKYKISFNKRILFFLKIFNNHYKIFQSFPTVYKQKIKIKNKNKKMLIKNKIKYNLKHIEIFTLITKIQLFIKILNKNMQLIINLINKKIIFQKQEKTFNKKINFQKIFKKKN